MDREGPKVNETPQKNSIRTLRHLLSTNSYYVLQAALIDINSQVV